MENQVETQEYKEYKEKQSSIVSDIYLVRRSIERFMPDCRERDRAILSCGAVLGYFCNRL